MSDITSTKYAKIEKGFPHCKYNTINKFNQNEKKIIDSFSDFILGKRIPEGFEKMKFVDDITEDLEAQNVMQIFLDSKKFENIYSKVSSALKKFGVNKTDKLAGSIIDKTIGFGKIGSLLRDEDLEEIMINSPEKEVFVFHKMHGMCKTDIKYSKKELIEFIKKVAKTVGRDFSEKNPLLDAALPDGSRVNATYDFVTPKGPTMTIRKFSKNPKSIIDLIDNRTIDFDTAAYLWLFIEGLGLAPQNLLLVGGTGSGKTTLLIALTSFIRYSDRIITIEDTPEINLQDRDNWIQMESRGKISDAQDVSMNALLVNSLRMRPDRLIVGEVRGEEAQTLFTAMDTGHDGILGTVHANNAKETLLRLSSKPMNVPENTLPLLNLIVSVRKKYNPKEGLRRNIMEIAELERMDKQVLLSNIFEFNQDADRVIKTSVPSRTIENVAQVAGVSKTEVEEEVELRSRILKWMYKNKITDYLDITKIIQKYYEDPDKIIKELK